MNHNAPAARAVPTGARRSALAALLATLLLHAALLATALSGWKTAPPAIMPPDVLPLTVRLSPASLPESSSLPKAAAAAVASAPPPKQVASPAKTPRPVTTVRPRPAEPKPPVNPPVPASLTAAPSIAPSPRASETIVPAHPPAPPPQPTTDSAAPASSAQPQAPAPVAETGVSISASYAASNRRPVQPAVSRRYGEQGTVLINVQVGADGTAGRVELKASSGFPLLDQAALTAVASWRFNPATIDGKPVQKWYIVPIVFKLEN